MKKPKNLDITLRFNNIKITTYLGKKPKLVIKDTKNDKKYKFNLWKLKCLSDKKITRYIK